MADIGILTDVQKRISHLTDEQLEELIQVIDEKFSKEKAQAKVSKKHLLGAMPQLIKYMAPDFNEPLEDFKDYMTGDL